MLLSCSVGTSNGEIRLNVGHDLAHDTDVRPVAPLRCTVSDLMRHCLLVR